MKNLALALTECQRGPRVGVGHNAPVDLEAFRWLLTEPGQRLLQRAAEAPEDPLEASALLRKDASAEQVAAALTQVALRRRAVAKFGDLAGRMYFTPDGLEQATRLSVAEHRAARLRAAGSAFKTIADAGFVADDRSAGGVLAELLAHAAHGDAEIFDVALMPRPPDFAQQMAVSDDLASVLGEFSEEAIFLGRQVHRFAVVAHGAGTEIDFNLA